jgi:hypothetical protein
MFPEGVRKVAIAEDWADAEAQIPRAMATIAAKANLIVP